MKYALISNQIIPYHEDSLKYVGETVEFIDALGIHTVTWREDFIHGTREELTAILLQRKEELRKDIERAHAKFPEYSKESAAHAIIGFLVRDGYLVEEIDKDLVEETTEGTLQYMMFNSSLRSAYMDYMH